jgi:hypothetical protein
MNKVPLELRARFLNKEFSRFLKRKQVRKDQNLVIILTRKIYNMISLKNQNIVTQVKDHSIAMFKN